MIESEKKSVDYKNVLIHYANIMLSCMYVLLITFNRRVTN